MARVYAPNESHTCDYGVDFIHGVGIIPDSDTSIIAWFTDKGYTIVSGSNTLFLWDLLPVEQIRMFAPYTGVDPVGKTKAQLVAAMETALITLMKIEITQFDAIPDINGGTLAAPVYADADAVKEVLPDYVTATFTNGIKATVPVTAWVDTDTYDPEIAGKYTFTATLGTIPTPFTKASGAIASVEVEVKAS